MQQASPSQLHKALPSLTTNQTTRRAVAKQLVRSIGRQDGAIPERGESRVGEECLGSRRVGQLRGRLLLEDRRPPPPQTAPRSRMRASSMLSCWARGATLRLPSRTQGAARGPHRPPGPSTGRHRLPHRPRPNTHTHIMRWSLWGDRPASDSGARPLPPGRPSARAAPRRAGPLWRSQRLPRRPRR